VKKENPGNEVGMLCSQMRRQMVARCHRPIGSFLHYGNVDFHSCLMTYCQQQTAALLIESKLLKRISGRKRDKAGYWNNTDYTARNTRVCSHVFIHFTEVGKLFQTQSAVIICTIRAKKGEAFGGKFTELV